MFWFIINLLVLNNSIFPKYNVETIEKVNTEEYVNSEMSYKEEIEVFRKSNKNNDIVGILEIENTDYVTPVVQSNDNEYYLTHLPNKKKSYKGSVFLDYRVNIESDKKLLIYGHNSSKSKMPFYILEKYYNEKYLNNHKFVSIKTENKIRRYELFSIFIETSDFSYMKINFNDKDYLKHLNMLKNKSMYKMDSDLDINTNILILQTCSTHKNYKKYKDKYLLLIFKEIENY